MFPVFAILLCSSVSIKLANRCSGKTTTSSLSVPSGQRSGLLDSVTTYEQEEDKLPVLMFGTEQVNL